MSDIDPEEGGFVPPPEPEFDPTEVEQMAGQALGPTKINRGRGDEWVWRGKRHRTDGPAYTGPYGEQVWYQYGKIHREGDEPAVIYPNGTKFWYKNGRQHRVGGPAAEYASGTKLWMQNGTYHRTDGPAIERPRVQTYKWYQWGKLHRTDGPAVETWTTEWEKKELSGEQDRGKYGYFPHRKHVQKWYINGRRVTPEYAQAWGAKGKRPPRLTGWQARYQWTPEITAENALALVANYLYEGRVDAAKKKYRDIPEATWDVFTKNDPSGGRQKYLDWIARSYVAVPEAERPNPDDVMEWVKKLHKRKEDINSLSGLGELEQKVTGEVMGSKRAQIMKGAYIIQDDADWLIVSPSTWAASKFYGGSTKWCVATSNVSYWYDHAKNGELIYFKNRHLKQGDSLWKVAAYWNEGNDNRDDIHSWHWYNTYDQRIGEDEIDEIWEAISPEAQKAILEMIENADPYNYSDNLENEVVDEHWENENGRKETIKALISIVDEKGYLTEVEFERQLAQVTDKPENFLHTMHWIGFYSNDDQFDPDNWGLPDYEGLERYYKDRGDSHPEEMDIIDELIRLNSSGDPMFDIIHDALDYWQWDNLIRYWGEENLRERLNDAAAEMRWKKGGRPGETPPLNVYNYEQVLDILRSTDPVLHEYLIRLSTTHESTASAIVSRLMG